MENNLDDYVSENIRDVFSKASAKQNNDNLAGDVHEICTAENKSKEGEKVMENKPEIAEAVKAEVAAYFAEKDAQAKVEEKISNLESEKASLSAKIDELTVANKSLLEENESLKEAKSSFEKEKADLLSEKESAVAECENVKKEIKEIKKEQAKKCRKEKLSKAGLLISDEKMQEKQIEKISDMTDEQFEDYVSELSAIASSISETKKADTDKKEETKAEASLNKKIATDGEIYAQTIASIQAPSCGGDEVERYAQM